MFNDNFKNQNKCYFASLMLIVISLIFLCFACQAKTKAEALEALPEPIQLDTIVPNNTKIPENLAYGATNEIDLNSVKIVEGGDYWKFINDANGLCLVPKNAIIGRKVIKNMPSCKIKIPKFVTDFDEQDLDCYLTLAFTNFKGSTKNSAVASPYYPCPYRIGKNYAHYTARALSLDGTAVSGVVAGFRVDCNVEFTYSGTSNVYKSDYPSSWIYNDIDQPSQYYDENGTYIDEFFTDPTNDLFYTESYKLGSGCRKTYIAKTCDLAIAQNNRLFYPTTTFDTTGDDRFDVRGIAVVNDAGVFDISWAVSGGAGSDMFNSGNYYTGFKLKKESSDEYFKYSLKDAVYGLYEDQECKILNRKLTLDENGEAKSAGTLDLDSVKYYLKELESPTGYKIDTEVHEVDLSNSLGKWKQVDLKDDPLTYNINTYAENGIITESKVVNYGDSKKIEYAPKQGYHLKSVTVDGIVADIEKYPSEYTFSDVKQDHNIEVIYEIDKFEIVSSAKNGSITKSTSVDYGENKTFEYLPKEGYHLTSLAIDGEQVDINEQPTSYTFEAVKDNHAIEVVFEIDEFTITTHVRNGSITESAKVKWGEDKKIEYSPSEGYHLSSVKVDNEDQDLGVSKESHEFNKIVSDHEIEVVYVSDIQSDNEDLTDKDSNIKTDTDNSDAKNTISTKTKDTSSDNSTDASSNRQNTKNSASTKSTDKGTNTDDSDNTTVSSTSSSGKKGSSTLPSTGDGLTACVYPILGVCILAFLTTLCLRYNKKR